MWLRFRLAVLQLAVAGAVFLLDMVHLPRRVREKTLRRFVSEVFGSTNTLKLGMCVCVFVWVCGYECRICDASICSAQSENLRNLEIALHILRILRLRSNLEIA